MHLPSFDAMLTLGAQDSTNTLYPLPIKHSNFDQFDRNTDPNAGMSIGMLLEWIQLQKTMLFGGK